MSNLITKRTGFGVLGLITVAAAQEALAIGIESNNTEARRLTISASLYSQPAALADIPAVYSRLVAWAGDEPTDSAVVGLDPVSAYFGDGQIPGRPLLDARVSEERPFVQEMTLAVQPQEKLWFYLGMARHILTGAQISGHISLGIISRESGTAGTQGLKPV